MGTKQAGDFPTLYRANDGAYLAWAREATDADVSTGRAGTAGDFLVLRDDHRGGAQWWRRDRFFELHTAVHDDDDDQPETKHDALTAADAIDPEPKEKKQKLQLNAPAEPSTARQIIDTLAELLERDELTAARVKSFTGQVMSLSDQVHQLANIVGDQAVQLHELRTQIEQLGHR